MKILSRLFLTALLGGAFALATQTGCNISLFPTGTSDAQSEPTRLFVLSAPESAPKAAFPRLSFVKTSIPAYLDTPQIVTRDGAEIARSGKISGASHSPAPLHASCPCASALRQRKFLLKNSPRERFRACASTSSA